MTKKKQIAALELQVSDLQKEVSAIKSMLSMKQDKPNVYFSPLQQEQYTRRLDGGLQVTCKGVAD